MRVANNTNFSGLNIAIFFLNSSKCVTFVEQQLKQQHLELVNKSKPLQLEQQQLKPLLSTKSEQKPKTIEPLSNKTKNH
jgi:regulator of replication initiation timing